MHHTIYTNTRTNYAAAKANIDACKTVEQAEAYGKRLDRIYATGALTDSEIMRIDNAWCDKMTALMTA